MDFVRIEITKPEQHVQIADAVRIDLMIQKRAAVHIDLGVGEFPGLAADVFPGEQRDPSEGLGILRSLLIGGERLCLFLKTDKFLLGK